RPDSFECLAPVHYASDFRLDQRHEQLVRIHENPGIEETVVVADDEAEGLLSGARTVRNDIEIMRLGVPSTPFGPDQPAPYCFGGLGRCRFPAANAPAGH